MNPKVVIAVDARNKAVASITGMLTVGSKVDVEIKGITESNVPLYDNDDKFVGRSLRLRIVNEMGNDLARYPLVEKDTSTTPVTENDKWTVANNVFTNASGRVFDMDTNELRRAFKCIPFNEQLEFGIILDSIKDNAQYAIGKVKVKQWAAVSEDDPTLLPNMAYTLAKLQNAKASVSKPAGSTTATISITDTHGNTTTTTINDGTVGPQGATGPRGNDGAAATIAVGTVTTGEAGTQASVVNSGTSSAAVFDFTIPRGAQGASGTDDNAVHYSADSNKTAEQKAAARTNIGAAAAATTLSGYGITDAKIVGNTITLGSTEITPLTSHQDISGKVDKESGKGLSTNDYTTAEKTKLAGIAAGATNVVESTVSGWGFTKNTGTYSKPSDGIPKADLASDVKTSLGKADSALQSLPTVQKSNLSADVQTSLGKADSALQSVPAATSSAVGGIIAEARDPSVQTQEVRIGTDNKLYVAPGGGGSGTVTSATINGTTKTPVDGVLPLGNYVDKDTATAQSINSQLSVGSLYVGGTRVEVVSLVPDPPIADTLYFVTGS